MVNKAPGEFGRFRSFFLPVHKSEVRLFALLFVIFFMICFNYNILRGIKDSLVVTAPSSGAEVIPFVKVWVVLPMAFLMTIIFSRLSNKYQTKQVFYIMMISFIIALSIFTFILFPFKKTLHPHRCADFLESMLPIGFKGFIALFRNWTYTVFYVLAEFWATIIMTVLFWGFTNELLNIKTAKRFYVLILIGGNLATICAGTISSAICRASSCWVGVEGDPWTYSLFLLCSIVIAVGGMIVWCFQILYKTVLNHEVENRLIQEQENTPVKMGMRKNFKYLANSKYLIWMAVIVLAYNVCINLTEVTWKDQLVKVFPNPNDFNGYIGKVTLWVGIIASVIALFSNIIIHRWSWTCNALISPLLLFITGGGFFLFLLFKETQLGFSVASLLGSSPGILAVLFGAVQQCISRASKYTLFDVTKELAFIPLDRESKLKGKAAIDGIGSRLGKSGSSIVYQVLLMWLGTVSAAVPYVGFILLITVVLWIIGVYSLGKQFQRLTHQDEVIVLDSETRKEVVI